MSDRIVALEEDVANAASPEDKAKALHNLVEYLTDADPKRALKVARELGAAANALGNSRLYINSLLNAAWASYNLADYAQSLKTALEGLKQARQHQEASLEFEALNLIGTNHQVVGNRPDALLAFMQALKLAQDTSNPLSVATVHNNIGLVYEGMEDYTAALNYYQQTLDAYRQLNTQWVSRSIAASNVAESHNHLKQYEQALAAASEAFESASTAQFRMAEGLALMHKGNAYCGLGQCDEAEAVFAESMALLKAADAPYQVATLMKSMANLQAQRGDLDSSINSLLQSLRMFEALEAQPAVFPLHKSLAQAYASIGDYRKAFYHMEQFHEVKERVFNEQADSREKTLQAMYEVDKARLEAENQRHRSLALQEEIAKNEALIAELDSYADNVAHDLKNPISLVISYGDLIQNDPENELSDSSQICLENLNEAAAKLNDIVSALLSLAKARKDEILAHPVDMTTVMCAALRRVQPLAERLNATIETPESLPSCVGNASWLEEALVNYISNALKYGGDPPVVRISAAIEIDGRIAYHVQDNGAGLSAEQQSKLFRKFERLGQNKIDGTGIGLMIVKTIVEKLGGQVCVSSSNTPGEGTIFSMILPSAMTPHNLHLMHTQNVGTS